MKTLLVNPPCRRASLIPLGLGYIASVLREDGYDVSVMDLNAEEKTLTDIGKEIDRSECDIIGIGGLSTTYSFVKDFSVLAKKLKPKCKIVAGNMVSTVCPELLLQNSNVDICVIDEGEETMKELVKKIHNFPDIENIRGIVFKKENNIIRTPARERITNLDKLPFPAWDLFPMEVYAESHISNEYGRRSMNVSVERGCPFQCIYCSKPFGHYVYKRSPENIIKEIKELKRRYRIKFIEFSDDLFTVDRKWVDNVCNVLIKEKLDIGWGAAARVNLVDSDLLKKMRKAGCEVLGYGFESGSQKILDNMKKGVKIEQAEKAICMTRKAGITVKGSFMIGMIGETEETVNETVLFIKKTGLALHRFFYTTPYPNTRLYEIAKNMGRIPEDEDTYLSSLSEMYKTFLVNLTDMPDEELRNLKEKSEREIQKNFPLRTRLEIAYEESRRIVADVKKRIKNNGIAPTMGWCLKKITQKTDNE